MIIILCFFIFLFLWVLRDLSKNRHYEFSSKRVGKQKIAIKTEKEKKNFIERKKYGKKIEQDSLDYPNQKEIESKTKISTGIDEIDYKSDSFKVAQTIDYLFSRKFSYSPSCFLYIYNYQKYGVLDDNLRKIKFSLEQYISSSLINNPSFLDGINKFLEPDPNQETVLMEYTIIEQGYRLPYKKSIYIKKSFLDDKFNALKKGLVTYYLCKVMIDVNQTEFLIDYFDFVIEGLVESIKAEERMNLLWIDNDNHTYIRNKVGEIYNIDSVLDMEISIEIAEKLIEFFERNHDKDLFFKTGLINYYLCKNHQSGFELDENKYIHHFKKSVLNLYKIINDKGFTKKDLYEEPNDALFSFQKDLLRRKNNERGRITGDIIQEELIIGRLAFETLGKINDKLILEGVDNYNLFNQILKEIKEEDKSNSNQKPDTILIEEIKETNDKQKFASMLLNLNQIEQKLIRLLFGLDGEERRTFAEIGKILNLPVYRVRELEAKTILKLRKMMENDESNT